MATIKIGNDSRPRARETSHLVLDVVPRVTAAIRAEMKRNRTCGVSVPQFRTLAFLNRVPGASLSDLADQIGLTLPAMSRLVDSLVERRLVSRRSFAGDRRRVTLDLTEKGRATLESARHATREYLEDQFAGLTASEHETVITAMRILAPLFTAERAGREIDARDGRARCN